MPQISKEKLKDVNMLDLETLGSQPIRPKNLHGHCNVSTFLDSHQY